MSKRNFYTLLNRYRNGECSEREKQLVEHWLALLDKEFPPQTLQESEVLEEKLWNIIQDRKNRHSAPQIWTRNTLWKWAAACIILVSVSIGLFYEKSSPIIYSNTDSASPIGKDKGSFRHFSSTDTEKSIVLADGSQIVLSPFSSIEYPEIFDASKREVYLTGKAFFEVATDPEKPFFVYSGQIVTRVLGTSFWVDGSKPGNDIEVAVVTGKVSVSKRTENSNSPSGPIKGGAILTANQKVRFVIDSDHFETGLVDNPVPLFPAGNLELSTPDFNFDDTPIADVVFQLEKTYGIEIILENNSLKNCLFRGDIKQQSLFTKLDLLCASVGAEYEVRGTRVLVRGKGCSY